MTSLDVVFRYGKQPGTAELRAIDSLREVYGVRSVKFNEKDSTVRVEFDASRMKEDTISALLRRAGVDIKEKLQLA
jgi:copper chaperone CopZ